MTALFIGPEQKAALVALRERAAKAPVDMPSLMERIKTTRGRREHKDRMTRQTVALPVSYMVTFSIETGHPCGTCRHMSMSTATAGRVPSPEALWMVAQELGFSGELSSCSTWFEDLEGHGRAVNVVQPVAVAVAEQA